SHLLRVPRLLHSFPTRRSSDLPAFPLFPLLGAFRVAGAVTAVATRAGDTARRGLKEPISRRCDARAMAMLSYAARNSSKSRCERDRKSTRLNSSHLVISYAVFC